MKSFIKKSFSLILLLCFMLIGLGLYGVIKTKATTLTGTITFSKDDVAIDDSVVAGDDTLGNEWTITTVGTTSYTSNASYYQVGSSKSPATSITFTTTLSESQTITSFSAKFGGFSGTAGTVTLKVGTTTVGTGSLAATSDVVTENSSNETGTVLTVTVTGISKGVKCYYISYSYEASTKALDGISVKTSPTKTVYEEGEVFDPTGLVITKTFDDSSTEDLAYAGHASDFTFSPTITTPLTTGDSSVAITVGGKSVDLSITVNPKSIGTLIGELTNEASLRIDYEFNRTFELVTNVSQLSVGDEVIIVAKDSDVALSMTQNTNNRGQVDITRSADQIGLVFNLQIFKLEAGSVDDTFAFYTPQGYIYAASSSSNYLKTQASKNDNSSFKIEIDGENSATLTAKGKNTRNILRYNSTNSLFSCYGSGQDAIQLYKAVSLTTTVNSVDIRFQVNMTTALRTRISSEGTSIEYGYLYAQGTKTVGEMTYGASGVESKACTNSNADGSYALVLTGVPTAGWGTEITVCAYVCVDGTYYYSGVRTLTVKQACETYISAYASEDEVKKAMWILDYIKNN